MNARFSENLLLMRLDGARENFLSALDRVTLEKDQELERPGQPVSHVYFVESGLVSVLATGASGKKIEVGMIGYEGMTATGLILGSPLAANLMLVQSAGTALRIASDAFLSGFCNPPLMSLWLKYAYIIHVQTSQTGFANGTGTITARLARWIAMWNDRIREPVIKVKHEYVAALLGVRRAGVTEAVHRLEGEHVIKAERNTITTLDRAGLIRASEGLYGRTEAEYERVLGGGVHQQP